MSKVDEYRQQLKSLDDWDAYLLAESRLPGSRANIELARVVAKEGDEALFERLLSFDAGLAPANTPGEYLAFCGTLGQGRLLAEGRVDALERLRACANDPRWRVREAAAMALQRWGAVDMDALLNEMASWSAGSLLERRAAAAALCEPSLLRVAKQAGRVLDVLDTITASLEFALDRKSEDFRALRKGLGYCWSVAVAAQPEGGKKRFERWLASADPDVCWVMKQNLKKKRLERMDSAWVRACQESLSGR
jgi:hypothetical protein